MRQRTQRMSKSPMAFGLAGLGPISLSFCPMLARNLRTSGKAHSPECSVGPVHSLNTTEHGIQFWRREILARPRRRDPLARSAHHSSYQQQRRTRMTRPSCSTYSFSVSIKSTRGFRFPASRSSILPLSALERFDDDRPPVGYSHLPPCSMSGEKFGNADLEGTGGGRGGMYCLDGPAPAPYWAAIVLAPEESGAVRGCHEEAVVSKGTIRNARAETQRCKDAMSSRIRWSKG